jgi:flagellar basal body rod protein FlgB
MQLLSYIPDNLSELLVKIVRFTELRRDVLYENIHNTRTPGYTPRDMPVLEFVQALDGAIAEHLQRQRLLFCDTENIKFGKNSAMRVTPVPDASAKTLLEQNRDEYVESQVGKLLENSLNRKVARELLRLKCGAVSDLASLPGNKTAIDSPFGDSAPHGEMHD